MADTAERLRQAQADKVRYQRFVDNNTKWAQEAQEKGDSATASICREQARAWRHSVHYAERRVRMLEKRIERGL